MTLSIIIQVALFIAVLVLVVRVTMRVVRREREIPFDGRESIRAARASAPGYTITDGGGGYSGLGGDGSQTERPR